MIVVAVLFVINVVALAVCLSLRDLAVWRRVYRKWGWGGDATRPRFL